MATELGDTCECIKQIFICYHERNVNVYLLTVDMTVNIII